MTSNAKNNIQRRLTINLVTIIILAICLCITTFALVSSMWVRNNTFDTGKVDIDLWGQYYESTKNTTDPKGPDKSIIHDSEFRFEPGMTVVKPAYVTNKSSDPVYCKLFFKDISGDLADILEITIKDGTNVLYQGKASNLTGENNGTDADSKKYALGTTEIAKDATKEYTVIFHYPKNEGNSGQGKCLEFTMVAEAVQTKNNPNAEF